MRTYAYALRTSPQSDPFRARLLLFVLSTLSYPPHSHIDGSPRRMLYSRAC